MNTLATDGDFAKLLDNGARPPEVVGANKIASVANTVRDWHQQIINLKLMEPGITNTKIAAMIGRSPSWVGAICNTDAFRDAMAARQSELNLMINVDLQQRLGALLEQSLDALETRLVAAGPGAAGVAMKDLHETISLCLKAVGYGGFAAKPMPGTLVQNNNTVVNGNVVTVDREILEAARARIRARPAFVGGVSAPLDVEQPRLLEGRAGELAVSSPPATMPDNIAKAAEAPVHEQAVEV